MAYKRTVRKAKQGGWWLADKAVVCLGFPSEGISHVTVPRALSQWQGTMSQDQLNQIPKSHVLSLFVACSTVDFKCFKATAGLHKKQPKAVLPWLK